MRVRLSFIILILSMFLQCWADAQEEKIVVVADEGSIMHPAFSIPSMYYYIAIKVQIVGDIPISTMHGSIAYDYGEREFNVKASQAIDDSSVTVLPDRILFEITVNQSSKPTTLITFQPKWSEDDPYYTKTGIKWLECEAFDLNGNPVSVDLRVNPAMMTQDIYPLQEYEIRTEGFEKEVVTARIVRIGDAEIYPYIELEKRDDLFVYAPWYIYWGGLWTFELTFEDGKTRRFLEPPNSYTHIFLRPTSDTRDWKEYR